MFPPSQSYSLDVEAISGICGSISIACWVVVFSPQIIENFRRSSAKGLSVEFIIIWLLGDFANIIGAVLQRVLPTMIILAIYYTLADIVLLAQYFYYCGFHFRDPHPDLPKIVTSDPDERTALLADSNGTTDATSPQSPSSRPSNALSRTSSVVSFGERFTTLGEHLSPATPMHQHNPYHDLGKPQDPDVADDVEGAERPRGPRSIWRAVLVNGTAIVLVVAAGVVGYYLSPAQTQPRGRDALDEQDDSLRMSVPGQIFGYLCAVLYLGSRVPQLLLNYRRKSTEGLNALFFLFACIGNLTYVLSIFAFEPVCRSGKGALHGRKHHSCAPGEAGAIYGRYLLVNLSWLLGSLGTLFLDMGVFAQFFMYRTDEQDELDDAIVDDAT